MLQRVKGRARKGIQEPRTVRNIRGARKRLIEGERMMEEFNGERGRGVERKGQGEKRRKGQETRSSGIWMFDST